MKISTFFYTLKQGIASIFRNKWFTLASVATIAACLFVFGIAYILTLNAANILHNAEERVSITVFFDEGIEEKRIQDIGFLIEDMKSRGIVARYEFVSAEQAWESFSKELGENAQGFTENPLADSANYQIYLNDISRQDEVVSYLESVEGIRKINKSDLTVDALSGLSTIVTFISVSMIVILFAVSIFLISNTVTIGISVRKEEINIMKYIGATDFFVRAPFVFEGMIIWFIGSAIPLAALFYIYVAALDFIGGVFGFLSGIVVTLPPAQIFMGLVPISLLIGVGIGFFGSFFTVRKHLRV